MKKVIIKNYSKHSRQVGSAGNVHEFEGEELSVHFELEGTGKPDCRTCILNGGGDGFCPFHAPENNPNQTGQLVNGKYCAECMKEPCEDSKTNGECWKHGRIGGSRCHGHHKPKPAHLYCRHHRIWADALMNCCVCEPTSKCESPIDVPAPRCRYDAEEFNANNDPKSAVNTQKPKGIHWKCDFHKGKEVMYETCCCHNPQPNCTDIAKSDDREKRIAEITEELGRSLCSPQTLADAIVKAVLELIKL